MNTWSNSIHRICNNLVLVVKFWFVRFYAFTYVTPSGVLYTDGGGCENCSCQ